MTQNKVLDKTTKIWTHPAVWVAALGYFVDIFDLLLFSVVRKPSLLSLGLSEDAQTTTGLLLHNIQMGGMLLGGILWGILGDRRGRLSVLFGSIFLYSVANFANAWVDSVPAYAAWRFLAGLGLAGELGAGITLVSEILPKDKRGYGTMLVATVGVSGAVVAGALSEVFSWRVNYAIGGVLGFLLLLLRIQVRESGLFESAKSDESLRKGDFFSLFTVKDRFRRLMICILIGAPIWFVIGILVQLSPEMGRLLGVTEPVVAGRAIAACYAGLVAGDFSSGGLSQWLQSRKRAVQVYLGLVALGYLFYFVLSRGVSVGVFYSVLFFLGFAVGYWAVFVTIAAESFGTNLRATVATVVPNFVRAMVIPLTIGLTLLKPRLGLIGAALSVGCVALAIALWASVQLKETFGQDLDTLEL